MCQLMCQLKVKCINQIIIFYQASGISRGRHNLQACQKFLQILLNLQVVATRNYENILKHFNMFRFCPCMIECRNSKEEINVQCVSVCIFHLFIVDICKGKLIFSYFDDSQITFMQRKKVCDIKEAYPLYTQSQYGRSEIHFLNEHEEKWYKALCTATSPLCTLL